ncbi:MAG: hypothetical protein KF716_20195 [Anaerolineae bacterium]|nr:hypothetical protein [Anaerolineae bacterium]
MTRTSYALGTLLPAKGYIPLWQPYLEFGDPLLENPVSFAFNPFIAWPCILFGTHNGIKVSIALTAIMAGLGGWAVARVLGLGFLGRMLLAMLCLGKGNMHSFLSQGHYALTIVQAYFPWIFAGVIGIFKGYKRWPIMMVAIAFSLVIWTGLPWFPPALVLTIGILSLVCAFGIKTTLIDNKPQHQLVINWSKLILVGVALGVALSLSMITMLPLWAKRDYIGESTVAQDYRADLGGIIGFFFNNVKDMQESVLIPTGTAYSYYSYISPAWYAGLIGAAALVFVLLRRKLPPLYWQVAIGGVFIVIFCTLWGAGQNPIIEWSYQAIPLANQFRHVARVLGLASLWVAILIAMGADVLWRDLVSKPVWWSNSWFSAPSVQKPMLAILALVLIVPSGVASYDVVRQWQTSWGEFFIQPEDPWEDYCISWLRKQYPDRELSVWTLDYHNIFTYLRNQVRHGWVASDFYHPEAIASTIYKGSLIPKSDASQPSMPEFAIGVIHFDDAWMEANGYVAMPESADPFEPEKRPCMYRRDGEYEYAFTVTRADLDAHPESLPVTATTPITRYGRDYDRIALVVNGRTDQDVVATVQELAYPGWTAAINGESANLESVGGQIGVVLPRSDEQFIVTFQFLPQRFFIGSVITLLTALAGILYLMHIDQGVLWLRRRLIKQLTPPDAETPVESA